jgi:hypothetical protein
MACINPERRFQDRDNYIWIRDALKNRLVVGTRARILYQDALGRMTTALKFNEMVRNREIGPVMLGRDHHDTGGTDPLPETANVRDGSNIMADMATHCFAGNAARGMSPAARTTAGGHRQGHQRRLRWCWTAARGSMPSSGARSPRHGRVARRAWPATKLPRNLYPVQRAAPRLDHITRRIWRMKDGGVVWWRRLSQSGRRRHKG